MSRSLDSLTQEEIHEIDQLIEKEAHEANSWMIDAGFAKSDYDAVVKYRDGYCGVSCDCVLKYLSEKGFEMDKIKKINPSGDLGGDTHYLVSDGTNILEPSYKQFLYTSVLDRTQLYNPKIGISKENIAEIEQLPGVFLGTPKELKAKITKTLIVVHQEERIESILSNYGLLVKDEQILGHEKELDSDLSKLETLESMSPSSDGKLKSPSSFKEKFISFKEINENQRTDINDDPEEKGKHYGGQNFGE